MERSPPTSRPQSLRTLGGAVTLMLRQVDDLHAYGREKFRTLVRRPSSLHLRWLMPRCSSSAWPRESYSRRRLPAASFSP